MKFNQYYTKLVLKVLFFSIYPDSLTNKPYQTEETNLKDSIDSRTNKPYQTEETTLKDSTESEVK